MSVSEILNIGSVDINYLLPKKRSVSETQMSDSEFNVIALYANFVCKNMLSIWVGTGYEQ